MMKAMVTDQAAGTAGIMAERREPAIKDVVAEVRSSGFTSGELWPSTCATGGGGRTSATSALDDAVAVFDRTEWISGQMTICSRP